MHKQVLDYIVCKFMRMSELRHYIKYTCYVVLIICTLYPSERIYVQYIVKNQLCNATEYLKNHALSLKLHGIVNNLEYYSSIMYMNGDDTLYVRRTQYHLLMIT